MEALISEFAWWLVTLIVVYAAIFLTLRFLLRRYVFPLPQRQPHADSKPGTTR